MKVIKSKKRKKFVRAKSPKSSVRTFKKKALKVPPLARRTGDRRLDPASVLNKFKGNPIIKPNPGRSWESKATFNPAALYADGAVHLLYRAIGADDVSVLGYAESHDGFNIDTQQKQPAYLPHEALAVLNHALLHDDAETAQLNYYSGGGGSGGCEDPRLVCIGDRVFMTFVAFNGWDSVRMALTSISLDDFLHKRWKWDKTMLISPPGEIHKNWVIFPEKIKGKYAILHSISPKVLIDYFDDLRDLAKQARIKSSYSRAERKGSWDNWIRGAGPPPIRTKHGWLVLYHAMDRRTPHLYKLGAMILDAKDPTKVLCRSKKPLLEPAELYENEGLKSGIVYSCGAVVKDGKLLVYYGGADTVVAVAYANLDHFLKELIGSREPKLKKIGGMK